MRATIIVDLGYGDSGKGTIVDYLTRERGAEIVVRYGGGAQCGHNVVLPDGTHHEFHQFGAGTLAGAGTHLSRFVCVNPLMLFTEEHGLQQIGIHDGFQRLSLDPLAPITTPFHIAANRIRETVRAHKSAVHGSVGLGIGETRRYELSALDVPRMQDCLSGDTLRRKLDDLRVQICADVGHLVPSLPGAAANHLWHSLTAGADIDELVEIYTTLAKICRIETLDLMAYNEVIFEGHQGVLLDEWRGFYPYNTWTDCTADNAFRLLERLPCDAELIGVTRAYSTRHGAGPFVAESDQVAFDEPHNVKGPWQGAWRQGWTDLVALRYAARCLGSWRMDSVAITHLDRIADHRSWHVVHEYGDIAQFHPPIFEDPERKWADRQQKLSEALFAATPHTKKIAGRIDDKVVEMIESACLAPCSIRSYGPTYEQKFMEVPA